MGKRSLIIQGHADPNRVRLCHALSVPWRAVAVPVREPLIRKTNELAATCSEHESSRQLTLGRKTH